MCAGGPDEAASGGRGWGPSVGRVQRVSLLWDVGTKRRRHQRDVPGLYTNTCWCTLLLLLLLLLNKRTPVCVHAGVLLLHHWHVWKWREASGVRGQRWLHQRAGRHHPTHPQQQGLMGYVGRQTWGHTVSRQKSLKRNYYNNWICMNWIFLADLMFKYNYKVYTRSCVIFHFFRWIYLQSIFIEINSARIQNRVWI